jgi:hypothetical protein
MFQPSVPMAVYSGFMFARFGSYEPKHRLGGSLLKNSPKKQQQHQAKLSRRISPRRRSPCRRRANPTDRAYGPLARRRQRSQLTERRTAGVPPAVPESPSPLYRATATQGTVAQPEGPRPLEEPKRLRRCGALPPAAPGPPELERSWEWWEIQSPDIRAETQGTDGNSDVERQAFTALRAEKPVPPAA